MKKAYPSTFVRFSRIENRFSLAYSCVARRNGGTACLHSSSACCISLMRDGGDAAWDVYLVAISPNFYAQHYGTVALILTVSKVAVLNAFVFPEVTARPVRIEPLMFSVMLDLLIAVQLMPSLEV